MTRLLTSLIVGFGRAGRGLHFTTLRKMIHAGVGPVAAPIYVLDPAFDVTVDRPPRSVIVLDSVTRARTELDPDGVVVHICTPPGQRLAIVARLAEVGFRQFLVEKPFTDNPEDLAALRQLRSQAGLRILVVGNLLASALTSHVRRLLADGTYGQLKRLHFDLRKPRFGRSLANSGHTTAFEIELPHALATALFLAGEVRSLDHAGCEDLEVEGRRLPGLGSASLQISHESGATTSIFSDLTSPVRQRAATFELERLQFEGHYAVSEADNYAQIRTPRDRDGDAAPRYQVLHDDSFLTFMSQAYAHFADGRECDVGDFDRAARAADIICTAKARCGITTPSASAR